MTKTLPISEAREQLRALVEQASRTMGRVIITRNGKPEAVLMGYDEYESWVETLDTLADPDEMEAIREGEADVRAGNVVSFEEAFGKPQGTPREGLKIHMELTERELTLLKALAEGQTLKEIAKSLHVSVQSVEALRDSVTHKLGLDLVHGAMHDHDPQSVSGLKRSVAELEKHVAAQTRKPIKAGR